MSVNYDDKRLTNVNTEKNTALKESEKMYDDMIDNTDSYFNAQIDANKDWEKQQTELQKEQTDFAIEQIEQQKEDAEKSYKKEQSAAYTDYKKQSNPYGVNAEQMASSGLSHSGYSESSQVAMYTAYQNRVATARQSFQLIKRDYDNAITQARLQNNAVLAEIAANSLQKRLELSLQGFQYKNQLLLDKANKKTELESIYYSRYQDALNQINTENAIKEEQRQFNASLAEEQRQFNALHGIKNNTGLQAKNDKNSSSKVKNAAKSVTSSTKRVTNNASKNIKNSKNVKNVSDAPLGTVKNTNNDELSVDRDSVLALGYGPITYEKLNELVLSGEVIEYEENGVLKFYRAK